MSTAWALAYNGEVITWGDLAMLFSTRDRARDYCGLQKRSGNMNNSVQPVRVEIKIIEGR